MIITIGRECGCGGNTIGRMLADNYGIPFYDKKAIIEIAKEKGIYERMPNFFAETPVNSLLYAIAAGEGDSDILQIPIRALKEIIPEKEFILLGRCGNYAYRGYPEMVSVFLVGDKNLRIDRIMKTHNIGRREAEKTVTETDARRASFQKYYTGEQWGLAKHYGLCIDSSSLGIDASVDMIKDYIGIMLSKN